MEVTIPKKAFNPLFYPHLKDNVHRYLVFYGGAGSGKSVFAVQRFLYRLLSLPLCNILVVRAVAATNRDSTYALFRQVISRWGLGCLFTYREADLRITCANGNGVIFKGLDNAEKLKSLTFPKGELTDIWVEEASEVSEPDFNQLDVRLRGRGSHKQMVLTFNPVSSLHWLKRRFFDRPDPRAVTLKSTYRDNRFLDEDYKRTLESYKTTDPYYYSVYCLGEWGVLGQTIFDQGKVAGRMSQLGEPLRRGEFTFSTEYRQAASQVLLEDSSIRLVDMPDGPVQIYQEPRPGGVYVLGADTAGEGSDYNVGQVVDWETGVQVSTLRGRLDEDLFAQQLYCLGKFYNTALIAVESNFSSYPIRELERLGYPRQYSQPGSPGFGFKTTSATRPLLIAGLVEVARDHPQWLNDRATLEEMLAFVRNSRGRPEAQPGAHDDCVMSLAIAYYVRTQGFQQESQPAFLSVNRRCPWERGESCE